MTQTPPNRQKILQNRIAAVCVLVFCVAVASAIFINVQPPHAQENLPTESLPQTTDNTQASYPSTDTRAVAATPKSKAGGVETIEKNDKALYIGLRKPSPSEIRQSLPEAAGKPALLMFHSKYCFDCKKMRPIIDKLMPEYTGITFLEFDILSDTKAHPAVFNTFKPVTVPVLVFITPDSKIQNVLYNFQNEAAIRNALKPLEDTKQDS